MAFLTRFLLVISFSLVLVSSVSAVPYPSTSKHATHRSRVIGGRRLESFHPRSTFKTFGADGTSFTSDQWLSKLSIEASARIYMSSLGVDTASTSILYQSGFSAGETRYAYLKQSLNGTPISNAIANVAFKGDKVVSYGSSFLDLSSARVPSATPTITLEDVLPQIQADFKATKPEDSEPTLEYLVKSDGSLALAYVVQLRNILAGAAYEVFVDANSGEVLSVTDVVAHATYTVVPIDKASITDGLETVTDPEDPHGNNLRAFSIHNGSIELQESANLTFTDKYDDTQVPNTTENGNAARANAFYVLNLVHDIAYRYGFTEAAFNFQQDNFGKGGVGNDSVQVFVQDSSGFNNAFFVTPPDGESGICGMFIWDFTDPNRDGAMQNDILIHEMTHGITDRMTGGGTARCLQTRESSGLAESWSDALAGWMQQSTPTTKDITLGSYVANRPQGVRRFPYSVNATTNPLRYSNLKQDTQVHRTPILTITFSVADQYSISGIGEVWANMLHIVYSSLVEEFDYSTERFTNPDGGSGNVVFLRLFIDALAIQPCNPTFVQAHDEADVNRYDGKHRCTVLKAFASRGLGANAGPEFDDDETIPADCSQTA